MSGPNDIMAVSVNFLISADQELMENVISSIGTLSSGLESLKGTENWKMFHMGKK